MKKYLCVHCMKKLSVKKRHLCVQKRKWNIKRTGNPKGN